MLSKTHFIVLAIACLFLSACSNQKKAVEPTNTEPAWLKQKPIDPSFYYGVGSANLVMNSGDYQLMAKQEALEDLASEIEVQLNAESVLHQKENNNSFIETYQSAIKISVNQSLEGFEPVDSWTNEQMHWVLYRLSKQRYQEIRAAKINEAEQATVHFITLANEEEQFMRKLNHLLEALKQLKPFLNENLKTTIDNQEVYLGSYLLNRIENLLGGLRLVSSTEEIELDFQNCFSYSLSFSVSHEAGVAAEIPFRYRFDTYGSKMKKANVNGIIEMKLKARFYNDGFPYLEGWIQTSDLVDDPLLLPFFDATYGYHSVPVFVLKPRFFVESSQHKPDIEKAIKKSGGRLAYDSSQADIQLGFDFKYGSTVASGNFMTSTCQLIVLINDPFHQFIFSKEEQPAKGVQTSTEGARQKAAENAIKKLDYRWYRTLIDDQCDK